MKCWSVPPSLFVSGRLMAPVHLEQEMEVLQARKKRLEAQLAALPGQIAELEQQLKETYAEFLPYKLETSK